MPHSFFFPPPVNEITIFTGYSFIINQTNQLTITHVQDLGFKKIFLGSLFLGIKLFLNNFNVDF